MPQAWRRVAMTTLLLMGQHSHGAAINTGVEAILWPAVIVASPFVIAHDFLFGSDSGARNSAEREANKIFKDQKTQFRVNGLYTGSINLRWALYGMLVETRLPFIEVNTAGSEWLLSLAESPQALITQAQQHPYIRLSFGKQGDPHCFQWKSSADDFTNAPPVRPGTCIMAVFVDALQSHVQLNVDASLASKRKLRWELIDRSTGKVGLSVPFWESQFKGQPLNLNATYRAAHESSTFISVLKTLTTTSVPKGPEGLPFVMNRFDERPNSESSIAPVEVQGDFRPPVFDWHSLDQTPANEHWDEAYRRAYAAGKPVVTGGLLIVPKDDKVGRSCASPDRRCDFATSFASDIGVLTLNHDAAYKEPEALRSNLVGSLAHDMSVNVAGRSYGGQLLWFVKIKPAALPAAYQACRDFSLACSFRPDQATTTDLDLVIRGVLQAGRNSATHESYELVVPLSRLSSPQR